MLKAPMYSESCPAKLCPTHPHPQWVEGVTVVVALAIAGGGGVENKCSLRPDLVHGSPVLGSFLNEFAKVPFVTFETLLSRT